MIEQLKKLSKWTNFYGWFSFLAGIFSVISGIWLLGIGAIPGLITCVLSWKLIKASKYAKEASEHNEEGLEQMVANLAIYFKAYGVLTILSLVIIVLSFIIIWSLGLSIASYLPLIYN